MIQSVYINEKAPNQVGGSLAHVNYYYGFSVIVRVSAGEVTPSTVAVMLVVPAATPVTRPVLLTVALLVSLEFHVVAISNLPYLPIEVFYLL
jgi:hypothetical protein